MKYLFKSVFAWSALATMLLAAPALVSCSKDETPEDPQPEQPAEQPYHFDVWVAVDKHGGMGRDVKTIVRSVASLEADAPQVGFTGAGTEVNATLTMEAIVKGAYYYQVPVSGDRFGKYTLSDNRINVIQEQRFGQNTYSPRKYTHAWIDDHTLVIMAADGDAKQVLWTKIDADDMRILAEGTLSIEVPAPSSILTTSGILAYRAADNKLFYFYYGKTDKSMGSKTLPFHTAVIDPITMKVERDTENRVASEMAGSAYGELLQKCTFFDEEGNLYLACFTNDADGNEAASHLRRIKAGDTDFDPSYDGFNKDNHKLVAVEYVGNGKALAYTRENALGTTIDSYSHYYSVIDLAAKTSKRLACNGQDLPYCGGRFSQRMTVHGGKGYVGIAPEVGSPCIYIYDSATDAVVKGVDVQEGFYFEQIRVLEDLE